MLLNVLEYWIKYICSKSFFNSCNAHCTLSPYRAEDSWWVFKEVGKERGWLKAKVVSKEDQMMPPVNGWKYYDGNKFVSDPTMVCSKNLSPACGEIVVQLEGKAKEKHPYCAGIYKPVKGKRQRGRWVGSYQRQSFALYNCH